MTFEHPQYKLMPVYLAVCLLIGTACFGQSIVDNELRPGQVLSRDIKGGESHNYQIKLKTNEFLRVVVDQQGIDVVVSLLDARGKLVVERDRPNGKNGEESLSAEAPAAGVYRVEITALEKDAPAGKYKLLVENPRTVTANDKKRIAAESAFQEGMKLLETQTKEARTVAAAKYETASNLWREIGDDYGLGFTLTQLVLIYRAIGQYKLALEVGDGALEFLRVRKDLAGEGELLAALGESANALGQVDEGLRFYERALPIFQALGEKRGEAWLLQKIGTIWDKREDHQKALDFFIRSLEIEKNQPQTLFDVGFIYYRMGNKEKELDYYLQAFRLIAPMETRDATVLKVKVMLAQDIVGLLVDLGKKKELVEFTRLALELTSEPNQGSSDLLESRDRMKANATTLVLILSLTADPRVDQATKISIFEELIAYYRSVGDRTRQANLLTSLSVTTLDKQKSISYLIQALEIFNDLKDKKGEANTLLLLGLFHEGFKNPEKARIYLERGIFLSSVIRDKDGEGMGLSLLSTYWKDRGDHPRAIFFGKKAVDRFQRVRQDIQKTSGTHKEKYQREIGTFYRTLSEVLVANGRIAEAEQVLALLKNEEYFEYLRRDDTVAWELLQTLSLTEDEQAAFKRYEELADSITKLGSESTALSDEAKGYPAGKFPKQARLDELEKQIADANRVFTAFLDGLAAKFVNKQTGQGDSRVELVSNTQALLRELKQPRTVIISTIAAEDV